MKSKLAQVDEILAVVFHSNKSITLATLNQIHLLAKNNAGHEKKYCHIKWSHNFVFAELLVAELVANFAALYLGHYVVLCNSMIFERTILRLVMRLS